MYFPVLCFCPTLSSVKVSRGLKGLCFGHSKAKKAAKRRPRVEALLEKAVNLDEAQSSCSSPAPWHMCAYLLYRIDMCVCAFVE